MWKYHVIDAYEEPADIQNWLPCPFCNKRPKVWQFDNGRFAKCWCSQKFGPPQARAESITSVYSRTKSTEEYDRQALQTAWNKYVATGKPQVRLPENIW